MAGLFPSPTCFDFIDWTMRKKTHIVKAHLHIYWKAHSRLSKFTLKSYALEIQPWKKPNITIYKYWSSHILKCLSIWINVKVISAAHRLPFSPLFNCSFSDLVAIVQLHHLLRLLQGQFVQSQFAILSLFLESHHYTLYSKQFKYLSSVTVYLQRILYCMESLNVLNLFISKPDFF